MATYVYRCPADGDFEVRAPMGRATASASCPRCAGDGNRIYTAPQLALADRRRGAVIDATERTRDEPDVVTSLPPRRSPAGSTTAPRDPVLARLPRP